MPSLAVAPPWGAAPSCGGGLAQPGGQRADPCWALRVSVSQVILCTKEVSVGARKNAFALLVEMGEAFLRFGPAPQGETHPSRPAQCPPSTLKPPRVGPWTLYGPWC